MVKSEIVHIVINIILSRLPQAFTLSDSITVQCTVGVIITVQVSKQSLSTLDNHLTDLFQYQQLSKFYIFRPHHLHAVHKLRPIAADAKNAVFSCTFGECIILLVLFYLCIPCAISTLNKENSQYAFITANLEQQQNNTETLMECQMFQHAIVKHSTGKLMFPIILSSQLHCSMLMMKPHRPVF